MVHVANQSRSRAVGSNVNADIDPAKESFRQKRGLAFGGIMSADSNSDNAIKVSIGGKGRGSSTEGDKPDNINLRAGTY